MDRLAQFCRPPSGARLVVAATVLAAWSASITAADPLAPAVSAYERGDYRVAFSAFLPHARQGDPVAQNYVGLMLSNGTGTQRDDKAAAYWFRQAASRGNEKAQRNLNYLVANGRATAVMEDLPEPECSE